jgi:hypothetical protein
LKKSKYSKSGLMGDQEDIFNLDTSSKYKGGGGFYNPPPATPMGKLINSLTVAVDSRGTSLIPVPYKAVGGRRKRKHSKTNSGKRRR